MHAKDIASEDPARSCKAYWIRDAADCAGRLVKKMNVILEQLADEIDSVNRERWSSDYLEQCPFCGAVLWNDSCGTPGAECDHLVSTLSEGLLEGGDCPVPFTLDSYDGWDYDPFMVLFITLEKVLFIYANGDAEIRRRIEEFAAGSDKEDRELIKSFIERLPDDDEWVDDMLEGESSRLLLQLEGGDVCSRYYFACARKFDSCGDGQGDFDVVSAGGLGWSTDVLWCLDPDCPGKMNGHADEMNEKLRKLVEKMAEDGLVPPEVAEALHGLDEKPVKKWK